MEKVSVRRVRPWQNYYPRSKRKIALAAARITRAIPIIYRGHKLSNWETKTFARLRSLTHFLTQNFSRGGQIFWSFK